MDFDWNENTVIMDGEPYKRPPKTYRYCLTGNNDAKNPLVVIGLNPSTADNKEPDQTMRKVLSYFKNNKNEFDGFVMINLYPLRSPCPEELRKSGIEKKIHEKNLESIKKHIESLNEPTILLAFGANIVKIPGLADCFKEIVEEIKSYNPKWRYLDKTKEGHPKHLLYLPSNLKLKEFNIDEYLDSSVIKNHLNNLI